MCLKIDHVYTVLKRLCGRRKDEFAFVKYLLNSRLPVASPWRGAGVCELHPPTVGYVPPKELHQGMKLRVPGLIALLWLAAAAAAAQTPFARGGRTPHKMVAAIIIWSAR